MKILKDLISFNTVNDKNNKEIINYIANFLMELGFDVKTYGNDKKVLVATFGTNIKLGFSGHTDTVAPSKDYVTDPFTLTIDGNKLIGLGTCDMKGGIAAFINALKNVDLSKLKYGIAMYLSYDEEIDFEGAEILRNNIDNYPELLIIGEPTNLKPIVATKGCLTYNLVMNGKASHASSLNEGINAIDKTIEFINEVRGIKLDGYNDIFKIPTTTLNIGTIKGGTASNMVPDSCNMTFEYRLVSIEDYNKLEEEIKKIASKYDCTITKGFTIMPFVNSKGIDSEIEKITGSKVESIDFVTEAGYYDSKYKYILGPGPVNPHKANEYITKKSYEECIKIYTKIIEKYCK